MNCDVWFDLVFAGVKPQVAGNTTTPKPGPGKQNARMRAACLLLLGWVLISSGPARAAMLEAAHLAAVGACAEKHP